MWSGIDFNGLLGRPPPRDTLLKEKESLVVIANGAIRCVAIFVYLVTFLVDALKYSPEFCSSPVFQPEFGETKPGPRNHFFIQLSEQTCFNIKNTVLKLDYCEKLDFSHPSRTKVVVRIWLIRGYNRVEIES